MQLFCKGLMGLLEYSRKICRTIQEMIQEKVVEISNPGLDFNNDTKGVK